VYIRTLICLLLSIGSAKASEPDFNVDRLVNLHDFVAFAQAFKTADASCDLNRDGVVNQVDIDLFVGMFQNASRRLRAAKISRAGRARLYLRQADVLTDYPVISVGDTLTVELFIEARNEQLTGVAVFLEFDDQCLELIPNRVTPEGILPFQQELFMQGAVFQNSTLGDVIGDSNANKLPLFQLYYNEDIPAGFGNTRRAATGDGVLATFQLRASWPTAATSIRVVAISPTGSETGYFRSGFPGIVHRFDTVQELTLSIESFAGTVIYAIVPGTTRALELKMTPSIAGQPPHYRWLEITDANGRAIFQPPTLKSGLYMIRAVDPVTDQFIGQWHSIPINANTSVQLSLPIGAPAQISP